MTDVFISYAHEDQAFVRRMTQALEAEGFSVWWDHTIPPGKTWNTYIARGIEEARACIVVWSEHSVESKWVMEEASLANDAEKLLPVAVSAVKPPMGFRSMQAAQLAGWTGDANNAQWQLLVRELRSIVSTSRADGAPAPSRPQRAYTPPPAPEPKKSPPWAIIGIVGAVLAVGIIAVVLMNQGPQEAALEATSSDTATAPATDSTTTVADSSAELERLRRERDDALEAERSQRATVEQLQQSQRTAAARSSSPMEAIVGEWRHVSNCSNDYRFTWSGSELIWERGGAGDWRVYHRARGVLTRAGYVGFDPVDGNAFEIVGDSLWLHSDAGAATERQCEFRRR